MESAFICKKCGSTVDDLPEGGSTELYCNSCGEKMSWDNYYPSLEVNDFARAVQLLFDQVKKNDEENIDLMIQILREMNIVLNRNDIINYRDMYEKICSKYSDNDDSNWTKISDEFEDYICSKEGTDKGIPILAAISVTKKNRLRKPCIIMIATTIEQEVYNYCNDVILKYGKVAEYGLLKNAGVAKTIDFLEKECGISLKSEIDGYSKTFYNCWCKLREDRNNIIHRNNKYISRIYVNKMYKLMEESITVFIALKKELARKTP